MYVVLYMVHGLFVPWTIRTSVNRVCKGLVRGSAFMQPMKLGLWSTLKDESSLCVLYPL